MSLHSDGGRDGSTAPALLSGAPYLVRMIEPNSIRSHDWHVQPNCQRSSRALRLSGAPLDRGPGFYTKVSSNLLRWLYLRFLAPFNHFGANFLTLSDFRLRVNRLFCFFLKAARTRCRQVFLASKKRVRRTGKSPAKMFRAAQNIKQRPAFARAAKARGSSLPGLAMGLFSAGFPTGVQGIAFDLTRPYEPASLFPLGAGHTATGRLHCSFRTFSE